MYSCIWLICSATSKSAAGQDVARQREITGLLKVGRLYLYTSALERDA